MIRTAFGIAGAILFLGSATLAGCSSDDDDDNGSNAGTSGTGGGSGGMACVGDPPVTDHFKCDEIASLKKNDAGTFTISTDAFTNCGTIPDENTCNGKAFGTGSSPKLTIAGVPSGTKSLALVFKDISILEEKNPALERFAYHSVLFDIPPDTKEIPAGSGQGDPYQSTAIPGALQWSTLHYGWFPPCPNPFERTNAMFTCSLVTDSYSFTLYALKEDKLTLPAPATDDMGNPVANYVITLGHYIEGLDAIAVTEYRGTSKAWSTMFAPPMGAVFPCAAPGSDQANCVQ